MGATSITARDEVATLASDLIRIDTTNPGDDSGPGERAAAEHVAALLAEVGLDPVVLESSPGRASVVTRIAGTDPSRPALLIHGHLDVVPADAADWRVHPLSGEIADDIGGSRAIGGSGVSPERQSVPPGQQSGVPCVWGRGAVDMKDMDAMVLAVVRQRLREGRPPPRDVVLAFLADEEAGGDYGAGWLIERHRELFDGVTEAIGEVGGFSVTVGGRRLYLLQIAEKGVAWMRLTARGTAGHGSMLQPDNAVTELAEAVARIGRHDWPVHLIPSVRDFLRAACQVIGIGFDENEIAPVLAKLGPVARVVGATLSNTANPTALTAGYKANVVPQTASALIDGRFLPGYEDEFLAELDTLLGPSVRREFVKRSIAVQTTFDGALCDAMTAAVLRVDPEANVVPYCLSGGTDGKWFSQIGVRCFGFAPLRLPPELDFTALFHGVDERVPVAALEFGTEVLDHFIDMC